MKPPFTYFGGKTSIAPQSATPRAWRARRGGTVGKPRTEGHGTVRAYQQHIRDRSVACRACLAAWRASHKQWRDKGKCAKGLGWPLEVPRG